MELRHVSVEDVLLVHNTLVADFAAAADPISPSGVRSIALLESAVGRQYTGLGEKLKYPAVIENAATLLFGLCNDHPFHNGNKRTALVATLVHLDKNKVTLFGTSQQELYDLMLSVASHRILPRRRKRGRRLVSADDEVAAIARWLRDRADSVKRGERQITYRELRRILQSFRFQLENPGDNMIEVVKYDERKGTLFSKRGTIRSKIGTIGWPGDNRDMGIQDIKRVRELCKLREEDGIDSDCFYTQTAMVDTFVNRYRTLLRRLARV